MSDERSSGDAERARRRLAAWLAPVALGLLVGGALFASGEGAVGLVGSVALAQGIGLAVAVIYLAFGRNPLSRR